MLNLTKSNKNWPEPAITGQDRKNWRRLASSDQDWPKTTKTVQTGQNRPNLAKMATNGKIGEYLIISRPTKTCFDWPKPAKLVRTGQDRTNWQKQLKPARTDQDRQFPDKSKSDFIFKIDSKIYLSEFFSL